MFRVIKNINETGVTILLVEQNVALALDVAHYGYVMETGTITLEGSAGYLRYSDSIKNSYL
jgi:branched-chain amino acid transport system ATP-binding protein